MKFKSESEGWNVYQLDDGTEVRVRTILVSIKRRSDQYQENGDPIYDFNFQQIVHIDCPDHLKLQAGPSNQTKQ